MANSYVAAMVALQRHAVFFEQIGPKSQVNMKLNTFCYSNKPWCENVCLKIKMSVFLLEQL